VRETRSHGAEEICFEGEVDDVAVGEGEVHGWKSSKCSDSHLLNLLEKHLLQPRSVIRWRGSARESFPHEEGNESVVFLPHVLWGLGFPISDFFRGLLFPLGGSGASLDP
jgi:hypothetical protein